MLNSGKLCVKGRVGMCMLICYLLSSGMSSGRCRCFSDQAGKGRWKGWDVGQALHATAGQAPNAYVVSITGQQNCEKEMTRQQSCEAELPRALLTGRIFCSRDPPFHGDTCGRSLPGNSQVHYAIASRIIGFTRDNLDSA